MKRAETAEGMVLGDIMTRLASWPAPRGYAQLYQVGIGNTGAGGVLSIGLKRDDRPEIVLDLPWKTGDELIDIAESLEDLLDAIEAEAATPAFVQEAGETHEAMKRLDPSRN